MKLFSNHFGFSMVEAMVGVGLLGAVGLGAMKLAESQKKAVRGQKQVSELPRTMVMIKQLANDVGACEQNFKGKKVTASLQDLKDAEGRVRFKQGDVIGKGEYRVTDIKLDGYNEQTNRAKLAISFDKLQEGSTSSKVNRFTFIHVEASGGTISNCLNPSEMSSDSLVKRFCKDIDPQSNDNCEDNLENLTLNVKELYCGKGHPFLKFDVASGKCLPLDANKACANGYIQGYDGKGELTCYVPPTKKGPPANKAVCSIWGDWSPSPDSVCSSSTVTQTRSCLNGSGSETRTVSGTKKGNDCCSSWSDWSPSSDSTCEGKDFQQTRTCQSGSGSETRMIKGTKPGGEWLPSVADVCNDKDVEQKNACGTRVVKGAKECNTETWSMCFIAGTQVTLANGKTKSIEDLVVDEKVLTYDEVTGSQVRRPIKEILHHEESFSTLYTFTFINGITITSNDVHPFYIPDWGKYISAEQVFNHFQHDPTISLLGQDGREVAIADIKKSFDSVKLYNIHVRGLYDTEEAESLTNHNYYANGVLVHNVKHMAYECGDGCSHYGECRFGGAWRCTGTLEEKTSALSCFNTCVDNYNNERANRSP